MSGAANPEGYLSAGSRLNKACVELIWESELSGGFSAVKVPNITTDQSDELTKFLSSGLKDIKDKNAREIQQKYVLLCQTIRGHTIIPEGLERVSIIVEGEQSQPATNMIQSNWLLNTKLTEFYFGTTQPTSVDSISDEEIKAFLRKYETVMHNDELAKAMLMNSQSRANRSIAQFQNWKTKAVKNNGFALPNGVNFTQEEDQGEAVINGNLFDFHVMAAWLNKNVDEKTRFSTLIYLESTSRAEKLNIRHLVDDRLIDWFCRDQENAMLVPGFRLTKSKLIASLYLLHPKKAGSIAALTFIEQKRARSIDLLSNLQTLARNCTIDRETAGVINSVCVVVRRFFQPRSYDLFNSRLDLAKYVVNETLSDWFYVISKDLLFNKRYVPAAILKENFDDMLNNFKSQRIISKWDKLPPHAINVYSFVIEDDKAESTGQTKIQTQNKQE